ncbi:B12-binding domain-containing radical SAM protein [Thermodesulfobacteriota bacterium]
MRILLITPRSEFPGATRGWLRIPQMSLLILAELTPPVHEVKIVDEEVEPIPWSETWDVVGISLMTATANRGYHLALKFRHSGAKVIFGGVHPSILPEEASRHADAIVIGEAEDIWPKIIDDIEKGNLQQVYQDTTPEINKIPLIRYNGNSRIFPPTFDPLVSSRGCSRNCEFCCVQNLYGRKVRRLPIEKVIAQIKMRRSRKVIFLDDNLVANRSWAFELFSSLKPYKLIIGGQVPVKFILDTELFNAAVEAGLRYIFVGVETIDNSALSHFRKAVPVEAYAKAIRRCRKAGVFFHAGLIFGMDFHTTSIFDKTLDFIIRHNVPSVSPYVLTPYPGTALYNRIVKENRIMHYNWSYYDHLTPVFRPARMTFEELMEGYMRFRKQLFSIKGILLRSAAQFSVAPAAFLGSSLGFRRTTGLLKEYYNGYMNWLNSGSEERTYI